MCTRVQYDDSVPRLTGEFIALDVTGDTARLEYRITCSDGIRKAFLDDRYTIEYEPGIEGVEESITAIPGVALVAPVAWLFGADVHVETLDATYRDALTAVKNVIQGFYPWFHGPDSHLLVDQPVTNPRTTDDETVGQLFTGGVDSLTSYIRHRAARPELFSIWEKPFYQDAERRERRTYLQEFAEREGTTVHFIKPYLDILNGPFLHMRSKVRWWPQVAVSLILTGLCAPVTVRRRLTTLYIASTHTAAFRSAWGSHPSVDNRVRWAATRVVHDGYDLSRMEKIRYLSRYPSYLPYLSCSQGLAQKTAITVTMLLLSGVDPHHCRFTGDVERTLRAAQRSILEGKYTIGVTETFWWQDLQRHIPDVLPASFSAGVKEYLTWLRGVDFAAYRAQEHQFTSDVRLRVQSYLNAHAPRAVYAFRQARARLRRT